MIIIPYGTDAPVYHFPWATIVLIVANGLSFFLTGYGYLNDGWLLQYANGLHPLEWVAYNFLHFGILHLVGNMFFLWVFGIVIEGKLGWWKFLGVYLGIGILGGFIIQSVMQFYPHPADLDDTFGSADPVWSLFEPKSANAQDVRGKDTQGRKSKWSRPVWELEAEKQKEKAQQKQIHREILKHSKYGAGGASLAVFGLLGIVLIWAPKNEVSCFYWIAFKAGNFNIEYIYFCSLKIGLEFLGAIFGRRGFEVTSEVGHAIGACIGLLTGIAFIKLALVDCENWDIFAYLQNKHGSMERVGSWQDNAPIATQRDRKLATPVLGEGDDTVVRSSGAKKKKKKALPKLKELNSFEGDFEDDDVSNVPT
jgi:membrane associated rhomboid family serine protease